jgi:hypothetical protein
MRKKQLCRIGLRKCWGCKNILKLNTDNFYRQKAKWGTYGYSKLCKKCSHEKLKKYKRNREKERVANKMPRLKLRFHIFQRDNFTCQYCGRKPPAVELQIDHIKPKSKGGENNEENYKTACHDCNLGKGDMILQEFL